MSNWAGRSIKRPGLITSLVITLFIHGCASVPDTPLTPEQPLNWQATIAQLTSVEEWELTGKIGVRVPERIDSAVINRWKQQGSQFTIDLSSAIFGLGATRIEGSPVHITMTESGEEPITSYYPEQLIQQHIGWPLPISQLRYWIKGMPAPATSRDTLISDLKFNEQGQLSLFNQSGWQIRYSRYTPQEAPAGATTGNISLPGKIILQQQHVKITVVINEWIIP